jgi:putative DNA primase/helicase
MYSMQSSFKRVNDIDAETLANALGGRRAGAGWVARCPSHHDQNPSLSIGEGADGRVLIHCHAGCEQDKVIAALRARGLWGRGDDKRVSSARPRVISNTDAFRTAGSLTFWQSGVAGSGTHVETILGLAGYIVRYRRRSASMLA